MASAHASAGRGNWRLQLTVGNLLDTRWREAQVPLVTILPGEDYLHIRGPLPDPEVNYTTGAPRQIDLLLRRGSTDALAGTLQQGLLGRSKPNVWRLRGRFAAVQHVPAGTSPGAGPQPGGHIGG